MLGHVDARATHATVDFRRKAARFDLAAGPGVGHQAAMLPLVEQEIAARRQGRPGRELARLHPQFLAVLGRVGILADHPAAAFAIGPEKRFQLLEMIALVPEPGNVAAATPRFVEQGGELPVGIAPETVAMNDRGRDVEALENELERVAYRGQAGAGRAGHGDDGMLSGHGCFFSPDWPQGRWGLSVPRCRSRRTGFDHPHSGLGPSLWLYKVCPSSCALAHPLFGRETFNV